MNLTDDHFLSLPGETIEEILIRLPVSNILKYCQTYSAVSNFCSDEKFWWQYVNRNWPTESLQKVLSFDVNDVSAENVSTLLHYRIGNTRNIESITNWPLAIAVFLENSKLITLSQIESNVVVVLKKILISRYDKLTTFLDADPDGYSSLIGSHADFYLREVTEGDLDIFRMYTDNSSPILKLYGEIYSGRQDYADVQIKDIAVDDKPLFDVITDIEIVKTEP
jgi:hypothetical protein